MHQFFVYILASRSHRLYVGVTNDLTRRIHEHRTGTCAFTSRYRITRLVHFETTTNPIAAIAREGAQGLAAGEEDCPHRKGQPGVDGSS